MPRGVGPVGASLRNRVEGSGLVPSHGALPTRGWEVAGAPLGTCEQQDGAGVPSCHSLARPQLAEMEGCPRRNRGVLDASVWAWKWALLPGGGGVCVWAPRPLRRSLAEPAATSPLEPGRA